MINFIKSNKQFSLFSFLALLILFVAIFPNLIAPKDPFEANMQLSLAPGSQEYPWGTDHLGRDILSRVIYGTRYTLASSLFLVFVILVLGTGMGVVAGFLGGRFDRFIMRIADMFISFPGLVLAIAVAGILGANLFNAVLAIASVSWPKYARLSRSLVLKIKDSLYIEAAKLGGASNFRILKDHIFPNIISTMLLTAATDIGGMMLELAALSFLGFGAQPPNPEWGLMLNEGRTYLVKAPWLMFYPGLAIVIVVMVFNMLGDSLRDILDPKEFD